ncbi:hypothetical protein DH2020_021607 [Rehmannia glutinosa]|uniref:Chorismate synthase n=1 Tax=Rehmannia glutinosa TaxID=99300 RepID=A0ABR0WBJ8_REHGL
MASYLSTKHFVGAPSSSDGPARLGSLQSPRMLPSPSLQLPARRSQCKRLEIQASGSTYGTYFRVTTFGESHGGGVGCVIDGCPPRLPLSEADMQVDLDRRRPGQSRITTPRKETDTCKIASGIADGLTTGSPIKVEVPNTDQRGHDYSEMSQAYRPSHADATYDFKYGVRSVQGGGRSSARETIGRVAAGAVAKKILKQYAGTEILSYVSQVHNVVLPENLVDIETVTLDQIESNIVRCPNPEYAEKMIAAIDAVRVRGDSVGVLSPALFGMSHGYTNLSFPSIPHRQPPFPIGLGSPVFDKLEAELAKAAMSLPATKGFEFGSGFAGTFMTGSEHNDEFYMDEQGRIRTKTNRSGGIQGGISNGETINMRIAFKPTSTISASKALIQVLIKGQELQNVLKLGYFILDIELEQLSVLQPGSYIECIPLRLRKQNTVTRDKHDTELIARGRHDPCVVPRDFTVNVLHAILLIRLLMSLMYAMQPFNGGSNDCPGACRSINGTIRAMYAFPN